MPNVPKRKGLAKVRHQVSTGKLVLWFHKRIKNAVSSYACHQPDSCFIWIGLNLCTMHSKGLIPTSTSYPFLLLHPYHAACHTHPWSCVQEMGTKLVPSCYIASKPLGHEVPQPRRKGRAGRASQLSSLQSRTYPLTTSTALTALPLQPCPWLGCSPGQQGLLEQSPCLPACSCPPGVTPSM